MGYYLVRVLAEPIDDVAEPDQPLMDHVHPRPAQGGQIPADLNPAIPELGLIVIGLPNHDIPGPPNPTNTPFRLSTLSLPKPLMESQSPPHVHPSTIGPINAPPVSLNLTRYSTHSINLHLVVLVSSPGLEPSRPHHPLESP